MGVGLHECIRLRETEEMARAAVRANWTQWSVVAASVAFACWAGRTLKRAFVTPPTDKEARVVEKERRKQIRRGLRRVE